MEDKSVELYARVSVELVFEPRRLFSGLPVHAEPPAEQGDPHARERRDGRRLSRLLRNFKDAVFRGKLGEMIRNEVARENFKREERGEDYINTR